MPRPIRKAVFPVAGLGTRFLPATKAVPKEMMTVVDKPVIQHVVDEAREAGIEHFVFVTGRNKGVIEDHFDKQYELDDTLARRNKTEAMEILKRQLPAAGTTSFTRQQEPLGLGHAVWCARDIVGDEPFALILPDMLHKAKRGCLAEMIDVYEEAGGGNVVAVYEVPDDQTHQYGIVGRGEAVGKGFRMTSMVEKPKQGTAQSNLAISGRYILQPEIFDLIARQEPGAGGEIQITDSMLTLAESQTFSGYAFEGQVFDTGSKLGFLTANVAYGLAADGIGADFRAEIEALLKG